MALNSRLFPLGSLKNIVHCSPLRPWKRRWGSIMNLTPLACRRLASVWKSSTVRATPKCGTGTSSASDWVVELRSHVILGDLVHNELVTEHVVVPVRGRAAFREAHDVAIELACLLEIMHRHRQMERRDRRERAVAHGRRQRALQHFDGAAQETQCVCDGVELGSQLKSELTWS